MTAPANLSQLIAREIPSLIELRHDLHAHPEVGLCEKRTSALVMRELAACGIEHEGALAGGTGVIAHISGRNPDAVALRCDIDALPISEETGLPYTSRVQGVMHACGHDGHTAIMIGTARVLAAIARESLPPRGVTMLFQPAEESLGGASRMIDDGCLAGRLGPPVSEIFGLHGWPWLPLGAIGVRNGPLLAAGEFFTVTIKGRGSHAGWPHLSHDVIVAMAATITSLQTIVSRSTDPCDSVVVSVCRIRAGDALNVLPKDLVFEGTIRTLGGQARTRTMDRFREVIDLVARAHECTATISFDVGCPATVNDAAATDAVRRAAAQMGPTTLVEVVEPSMGGEDFAWYGQQVPASFFLIGLRPRDESSMPGLHHPAFDFNDDAIAVGVEAMCRLALEDR
ncbi:MAG: amidohydrolase [Phycisphaerales bacterium]|nr:amidohydrolase [Phycisphaerales bacterium]